MIDTATISEQAANWTDTALIVATLVLGILFALVYAAWGARNDFSVPRVVVPAVGIPSLALIVLLSLTPAGEKNIGFRQQHRERPGHRRRKTYHPSVGA